jgi:outer membrane protein assembly factor BamA
MFCVLPFQGLDKTKTQMKKILVLIPAFLLAFQISKAQTEKGSQTLGLNLQFSHQQSTTNVDGSSGIGSYNINDKSTTYSVGPTYSYFVADKLDLGVNASFSYTKFDIKYNTPLIQGSNQVTRQYGANVFLRKYFMFTDKLGLRAGPYLGYFHYHNNIINEGTQPSGPSNSDNYIVGGNADFVFYPAKRLGFSATLANLNYVHSVQKDGSKKVGDGDNVNLNFINNGLALSVFYVFGGK